MNIEREVLVAAAPLDVERVLGASPWHSATTVDPAGAGSRVAVRATVEPAPLAAALDELVLAELRALRDHFDSEAPFDPSRAHAGKRTKDTSMTTIERSVTIDAPPARVWDALADFGGVATWNPNVKRARLTSAKAQGDGASRECVLSPMGTVQERITGWIPGEQIRIEIYDHKNLPGMRTAEAQIDLVDRGERTEATCRIDYRVGLGPVGAGMNAVMMKRLFGKTVAELLAGLKYHVETGRAVEKGTKLDVRAVSAA